LRDGASKGQELPAAPEFSFTGGISDPLSILLKMLSTPGDTAASDAAHLQNAEKEDIGQLEKLDAEAKRNGESSIHITAEMEQRLLRKLDLRLVPRVMGLCMISSVFAFIP
jgi:hypothetical protein